MSLLLIEGFEDGIVHNNLPGKWDVTGRCSEIAGGRNGKGGRIELTSNSGGSSCLRKALGDGEHATIIMGFALEFGAPSSNLVDPDVFLAFRSDNNATSHVVFYLNSDGVFTARRGHGGTVLATASQAIPTTGWTYIEIKVTLDDTAGAVILKADGTELINFTGDTKNGGTETVIDNVDFFLSRSNTTVRHDLDDLYICNGAGTSHNDFLGDHRVDLALPVGNGNHSQLTGSDGDSVDNHLLVDENPPDTADYVGSGTDGDKDTYDFADAPAGRNIAGVQTVAYAAKTTEDAKSLRQLARIGTTDHAGTSDALNTTHQAHVRVMETSPATDSDWTEDEFNAAEFGVEVQP